MGEARSARSNSAVDSGRVEVGMAVKSNFLDLDCLEDMGANVDGISASASEVSPSSSSSSDDSAVGFGAAPDQSNPPDTSSAAAVVGAFDLV